MSIATPEQLNQLVSEAALDPAFRAQLKASPTSAAATKGVKLDKDDEALLRKTFSDLDRFGTYHGLQAIDAKSWAIGICHYRDLYLPPPKHL
jgi:hypothetical protein